MSHICPITTVYYIKRVASPANKRPVKLPTRQQVPCVGVRGGQGGGVGGGAGAHHQDCHQEKHTANHNLLLANFEK
jgi:hypothetical protein